MVRFASTPKVQYSYADGSAGTVRASVPESQYDGRNFRVVRKDYASGVLTEARHFYYTSAWQVLEERVDSSSNPNRQFVWGLRYIDDLILRDRDTTGGGTLDERLYALQDGNWNVTSICDENGDVQERYAYTAYGEPLFLSAGFVEQSGSSFGWEVLFTGQRWDGGSGMFDFSILVREAAPQQGTPALRFLHATGSGLNARVKTVTHELLLKEYYDADWAICAFYCVACQTPWSGNSPGRPIVPP